MSTVSISRICKKSQYGHDFRIPNGELFLCAGGLKRHWDIDTAKTLEIRLHNGKPSMNAHRFRISGYGGQSINIIPEANEKGWHVSGYGTYSSFASVLSSFILKSNSKEGWMEVSILE
jgi:hypothetical protein